MKFLIFADLHYHPHVFYGSSWETLRLLQRRAEEENCDMIIHAGDFCHGPSLVEDYVSAYNNFHIPSYHCLGNHDTDNTSCEQTLNYYNMPDSHYFFDCKGYRFLILDTNYLKLGDQYIHFEMKNYFKHPESRGYASPAQLDWLQQTLDDSPFPCIIISHDSFEREHSGVKEFREFQDIVRRCNEKTPGKVLMAINGHYHRDNLRILDGVLYWDLNSVHIDWVPVVHDFFPEELCKEWSNLNHTVVYKDPLYAIVTLDGNTIQIQGTESAMFMDVSRETIGCNLLDGAGRPVRPRIQSAKITLG